MISTGMTSIDTMMSEAPKSLCSSSPTPPELRSPPPGGRTSAANKTGFSEERATGVVDGSFRIGGCETLANVKSGKN